MYRILAARLKQGFRAAGYPSVPPELPDRFRGLPVLDSSRCPDGCSACEAACPTDAIHSAPSGLSVDLGRCLFCSDCVQACPEAAITHSTDHRLATRSRHDLLLREGEGLARAAALDEKMRRLFGRSLKLRQVSAGGCNACEADINVLGTVVFDLGRFGIQVVASPRHADGLLITGPVSANMALALKKTYDAVPAPKVVIAVGACAISGGPYIGHPEVHGGADGIVPVDLYIPGCPPHPYTILDGLLRLLGRIEHDETRTASACDRLRGAAVTAGEANIRENARAGILRATEAATYLGVAGKHDAETGTGEGPSLIQAPRARAEIASGTLRGSALLELVLSVSPHRRDDWIDAVLGLEPPPPDALDLPRGSVPYLPCGVEEILTLLREVPVRREDVLVDLGSGLGRVAILVHLLSGARTRGIEIQEQLVQRARAVCAALAVPDVSFVHGDAAEAQLDGSIFFLYAPFNGRMLTAVLRRLEEVARRRSIVVCTVGLELGGLAWLHPRASANVALSVYDSRFEPSQ